MEFKNIICAIVLIYLLEKIGISNSHINTYNMSLLISTLCQHFMCRCVMFISSDHHQQDIRDHQMYLSQVTMTYTVVYKETMLIGDVNECEFNDATRPLFVIINEYLEPNILKKVLIKGAKSKFVWLIVFKNDKAELDLYFSNISVSFDSEVLVGRAFKDGVELMEVYKMDNNLPLVKYDYGLWDPTHGLKVTSKSFYDRRNRLQGKVFQVAVPLNDPATAFTRIGNDTQVGGIAGIVWHIIMERLQFTTNYHINELSNWGIRYSNGTWDGMIGTVIDRECDMLLGISAQTPSRANYVDFALPFMGSHVNMYIRESSNVKGLPNSLVAPFSPSLWSAFLLSVVIISIGVILISRIPLKNNNVSSWGDTLYLHLILVFCNRGFPELMSHHTSRRIVVLTVTFLGIIASITYCARVVSLITLSFPKLPFHSLEGILDDGTYSLAYVKGTAIDVMFKEAKHGVYKEAYDRLVTINSQNTPSDYAPLDERVCYTRTVIVTSEMSMASYNWSCKIVVLKRLLQNGPASYLFYKSHPLIGFFNDNILRLMSNGVLKKISNIHLHNRIHLPESVNSKITTINLRTVTPILLVLLIGAVLAFLFLFIEIALHKCTGF